MQAIVKNALEPEWEARFEPCSYGFRPGRSCHDAMVRIFALAKPTTRMKWVVDADIKGAFDNIRHATILEALAGFPARHLVRQWLKAGVVDRGVFTETTDGTPQGGIASPLLANIAFHGLESAVGVTYRKLKGSYTINSKRALVRYADDLVIFAETREDAKTAKSDIAQWLADRGTGTLAGEDPYPPPRGRIQLPGVSRAPLPRLEDPDGVQAADQAEQGIGCGPSSTASNGNGWPWSATT